MRNLLGSCSDQLGTNHISQTTAPQLVIADKPLNSASKSGSEIQYISAIKM
jgi:hypothetical protein